ncbi:Holliday junction branch migration protein RuvA [Effusibacillus lacus]|uniref:Holliday junction branch migration complex subunit RuvA n=1 Tax=Effusibacillus lacus TaxID=1348429 RepID=A0A292YSS1_9BACL|nr:Holliday junction branch migration protein RuvA [Effusibacillus lacus]TCS68958.1 Holliday junction DNA helicase subunit RuvA [Effusibacillus lacus]GAX91474.1 Holliday junction branch migration protein RuvA [Effusibacillus lacus]
MIAFVEGIVEDVAHDHTVVNVNGIGYRVYVSGTTAYSLQPGSRERLYTQQHVREDAITLYGFKSRNERDLFVRLQNVSGVGPKAAMTIVGAAEVDAIVEAIQTERVDFLKRLPGIGQKTAQRLIIELKDKLDDLGTPGIGGIVVPAGDSPLTGDSGLFDALLALGYNEKEARAAVRKLSNEAAEGASLESLIKKALQLLAK